MTKEAETEINVQRAGHAARWAKYLPGNVCMERQDEVHSKS